MARCIVFTVFLAFSIMMLVVGIKQYFTQRALLANPMKVKVRITRSDVTSHKSADTDNRTLRDNSTTSYTPNVRFEYEINGKSYTSEMLRPTIIAQSYASHNSAADELKMFPIGATVEAFYSAEHPDKAFLLSESSAAPVVFIVVGILSPIIGFLVCKYLI